MQAHEIMIHPVYKVKESDTVRTVVEKFVEHRIGGLPVVNDKNETGAFISDGDIMRYIGKQKNIVIDTLYYALVKGDDLEFGERAKRVLDLNVMDIVKKGVFKVAWDEEIENVAAILGKKQIKNLPVERNGELVGIISRGDVIRHAFKGLL